MENFIKDFGCDEMLLNDDGFLYMGKNSSKFNFKKGIVTVSSKLGLPSGSVQVINDFKMLPEEFLIDAMKGEFDASSWKYRYGNTFLMSL